MEEGVEVAAQKNRKKKKKENGGVTKAERAETALSCSSSSELRKQEKGKSSEKEKGAKRIKARQQTTPPKVISGQEKEEVKDNQAKHKKGQCSERETTEEINLQNEHEDKEGEKGSTIAKNAGGKPKKRRKRAGIQIEEEEFFSMSAKVNIYTCAWLPKAPKYVLSLSCTFCLRFPSINFGQGWRLLVSRLWRALQSIRLFYFGFKCTCICCFWVRSSRWVQQIFINSLPCLWQVMDDQEDRARQ